MKAKDSLEADLAEWASNLISQLRLRLKVEKSLVDIKPRGTLGDYVCACFELWKRRKASAN